MGSPGIVAEIGDTEVLIAAASDPASGHLSAPRRYRVAEHATFTEILMDFAREEQCPLWRAPCAVILGGAVHGQSVTLARGKWTIARNGIAAMTDAPVFFVNDVAAAAWALLAPRKPLVQPLKGQGAPRFEAGGRWAVLKIDHGVGLAAIDMDESGMPRVLDCEAGHMSFAPADERELRLATASRWPNSRISWEQMLTLQDDDPAWDAAGISGARGTRSSMRAALIGAFAGDVVLALGAWSGVLISGKFARQLRDPAHAAPFISRFEDKRPFHRLVAAAPCWTMTDESLGLSGGAAMLAHALRNDMDGMAGANV